MAGRLQFDLNLGPAAARNPARARRGPMRLLVIGDFSGASAQARKPLAERPTLRVDLDNFDALLARLAPALTTPGGRVEFGQIDDFHPDGLYARLEIFDTLRRERARPPEAGADLLGSLLGKAAPPAASAPTPASGIDAFIRSVVAPHIVPDTQASTRTWAAVVDDVIAEQMRRLLHDPGFQALEAAWRGLHWLMSRLELDENLQLHLFDATRDELIADVVAAGGQLGQTGLHQALTDRWRNVPGAEGWSALAGLYAFGSSDTDIGLLAALGLIASQAGGPFLARGDEALAGAPSAGWQALRASEAAPWIGLAAPRLLLRLPYGKGGEPITAFSFDEFVGAPLHEEFLWGNPSLAVALLLGRSFAARAWEFEPGDEREITDLPAYAFVQDGEMQLQACAEKYLADPASQGLLDAGLMPVLSHRNRHAVTLPRLHSVASPPAALIFAR